STPLLRLPNSSCTGTVEPSGPTGIAQWTSIGLGETLTYLTNYYSSRLIAFTWGAAGGQCTKIFDESSSNDAISQIHNPEGVAVDARGEVFVSNVASNA